MCEEKNKGEKTNKKTKNTRLRHGHADIFHVLTPKEVRHGKATISLYYKQEQGI